MSASLEAYLARLYLDTDARRAFTAAPRPAATRAGLAEAHVAALERAARVGLELTARSFSAKHVSDPRQPLRRRLLACCRRLLRRCPPWPGPSKRALRGGGDPSGECGVEAAQRREMGVGVSRTPERAVGAHETDQRLHGRGARRTGALEVGERVDGAAEIDEGQAEVGDGVEIAGLGRDRALEVGQALPGPPRAQQGQPGAGVIPGAMGT
jgi:hypothetical protein